MKLVKECQSWFLDEVVKDDDRMRKIKDVLQMSEYVPSIFLEIKEEGFKKGKVEGKLEMAVEMLKDGCSLNDVLKVSHLPLLKVQEAANRANINIKNV